MKKYPLTQEELRLWFEWKLNPDGRALNTAVQLELHGELNLHKFKEALKKVYYLVEVYRSYFIEEDGVPYQVCLSMDEIKQMFPYLADPEMPFFNFIDFSIFKGSEEDRRALAYAKHKELIQKKFTLTQYPLAQCNIIKYANDRFLYSSIAPHICVDGHTGALSIAILTKFYNNSISSSILSSCAEKFGYIKNKAQYFAYREINYPIAKQKEDSVYWVNALRDAKLHVDCGLPKKTYLIQILVKEYIFLLMFKLYKKLTI